MTDHSERIPVGDEYIRALGRATYNFSYLEWAIIWLGETLQPGLLQKAPSLTAGQFASEFSQAVNEIENAASHKTRLQTVANKFSKLVTDRNSLMHSNPHTAMGGEQRLLHNGKHGRKDWTIESMRDFSSRACKLSIEAGRLEVSQRLLKSK